MRHPIDFDGIKAAALRSARQLLQELLPGGKFQGMSTSSEILFGMTNTRDRSRSTARQENGATSPSAKAAAI